MRTHVLVVAGPTATGKSGLAVEAALALGGEIVSADSMQLYRGMDIGTAKVSAEEMRGVPHHMIDVSDPGVPYTVAQYQEQAAECIDSIAKRGRLPILVGGSGLHVSSITSDMDLDVPPPSERFRRSVADVDSAGLHRMLALEDPVAAARIHPNNRPRVVRALEIVRLGGTGRPYAFGRQSSRYNLLLFGLGMEREQLYGRIGQRVDQMVEQGLLSEAEALFAAYPASRVLSQAIGYKELWPCLAGDKSLEEAVEEIKRNTRRFAKRQMTWFRRDGRMEWLDAARPGEALERVLRAVRDTP